MTQRNKQYLTQGDFSKISITYVFLRLSGIFPALNFFLPKRPALWYDIQVFNSEEEMRNTFEREAIKKLANNYVAKVSASWKRSGV